MRTAAPASCRGASDNWPGRLYAFDTVIADTPAACATVSRVGRPGVTRALLSLLLYRYTCIVKVRRRYAEVTATCYLGISSAYFNDTGVTIQQQREERPRDPWTPNSGDGRASRRCVGDDRVECVQPPRPVVGGDPRASARGRERARLRGTRSGRPVAANAAGRDHRCAVD